MARKRFGVAVIQQISIFVDGRVIQEQALDEPVGIDTNEYHFEWEDVVRWRLSDAGQWPSSFLPSAHTRPFVHVIPFNWTEVNWNMESRIAY